MPGVYVSYHALEMAKTALTAARFASGRTFDEYIAYIATPEVWGGGACDEIIGMLYERMVVGSLPATTGIP